MRQTAQNNIVITQEEYDNIILYMMNRLAELEKYPSLKSEQLEQRTKILQFQTWKTLNYVHYTIQPQPNTSDSRKDNNVEVKV